MGIIIKTERLVLRNWNPSDAKAMYKYAKDPDVGPRAGWPAHESVEVSQDIVRKFSLKPYCFAICLNDEVIGCIELMNSDQGYELGYWLGKPYWGHGYMKEAASALIEFGFEDLKIDKLWCAYYDGNLQSKRVQEKLGFVYHHTIENDHVVLLNEVRKSIVNLLTKEDWAKRNEFNKQDYLTLQKFWDNAFKMDDNSKKEIQEYASSLQDYDNLAPSQKLADTEKQLLSQKHILDYGSGSGWASIILGKNGANDVLAVDVSPNSVQMLNVYLEALGIQNVRTLAIEPNWLETVEANSFDGVVCSNVLDVLPTSITKYIIKEFSRILEPNGLLVIGLNYYLDMQNLPTSKFEKKDDTCLYIDGVLRLNSFSDEGWTDLFKPYFDVLKLDHFAWPGEKEEKRRLFLLKKR